MFANIAVEFPHYGISVLSTSPWIVTFDNFLTDEEADALISTNEGNWERSTDTGSVNEYENNELLGTEIMDYVIRTTIVSARLGECCQPVEQVLMPGAANHVLITRTCKTF